MREEKSYEILTFNMVVKYYICASTSDRHRLFLLHPFSLPESDTLQTPYPVIIFEHLTTFLMQHVRAEHINATKQEKKP